MKERGVAQPILPAFIDVHRQRVPSATFVRFEPTADNKPLAFSTSELRKHVQTTRREVFNVSKAREGMEEITKLYATTGYIDMVPEPKILNGEDGGPVELVIKIDEGKQYRVGKIDFVGLDEETQDRQRARLKPGDPYNSNLVDELLKRNKPILPSGVSREDLHLVLNTREGVVDIRFDFCSYPKI